MRILAVTAAFLVGLLLQAMPAAAHAERVAAVAKAPAAGVVVKPEAPLGVCAIDPARLEAFVKEHPADKHVHGHHADGAGEHDADAGHNPADHTHGVGEDSEHQAMSHGGFDMAAHADQPQVTGHETVADSCGPAPADHSNGILHTPPVRPPLG